MKDWDYENEQWTQLAPHLKHLPLFTRHLDFTSLILRSIWAFVLKFFLYRFYLRLRVVGDFKKIHAEHPRLLIISNHASHLDAVSITVAVPLKYWPNLYITAAKDYFFSNPIFAFFSRHCLGAIPIDRKDKKAEALQLCLNLLNTLNRIWLIIFPEGTRSPDGYIKGFKRGVSVFARKTKTPILCLYLDGPSRLWPKGQFFTKPGRLTLYVGPVLQPTSIEEVYLTYQKWVLSINPNAYLPKDLMRTEGPDEFDALADDDGIT